MLTCGDKRMEVGLRKTMIFWRNVHLYIELAEQSKNNQTGRRRYTSGSMKVVQTRKLHSS